MTISHKLRQKAASHKLRQIDAGSMCHVDCQIDAGGVAKSLKLQAPSCGETLIFFFI